MNDIAYCTDDNCQNINCIRNQKNITDYGILHQRVNKEEVPECPFNQLIPEIDALQSWLIEYAGDLSINEERRIRLNNAAAYLSVLKQLVRICPNDLLSKIQI